MSLCGLAVKTVSYWVFWTWANSIIFLMATGFYEIENFYFCFRGGTCGSTRSR